MRDSLTTESDTEKVSTLSAQEPSNNALSQQTSTHPAQPAQQPSNPQSTSAHVQPHSQPQGQQSQTPRFDVFPAQTITPHPQISVSSEPLRKESSVPPPTDHSLQPLPDLSVPQSEQQYTYDRASESYSPLRYSVSGNGDDHYSYSSRSKREVKRRTKTGCLTCRKRRIKCDETLPHCRNCEKSKRECLGYDPGITAEGTISPRERQSYSHKQPRHHSSQLSASSAPRAAATSHRSSGIRRPPMQQSSGSSAAPSQKIYSLSAYGAPVVAAAAAETPAAAIPQPDEGSQHDAAASLAHEPQAKRTKLERLLCINGISPPPPAPPSVLSEDTKRDIRSIYSSAYAPGMDKFLEVRWFSERGLHYLMNNAILCNQFALLVHRYAMNPLDPAYYIHYGITQSLEAMVVWAMLSMCRRVAIDSPQAEEEVQEGVHDAAKRLAVFEALVTGEAYVEESHTSASTQVSNQTSADVPSASPNGTTPSSNAARPSHSNSQSNSTANANQPQDQLKHRENEFWSSVQKFVSFGEDNSNNSTALDAALIACRGLLERRENRDVIYSIMVVRHVGAQIPNFPNMAPPETNDERNAHAKVAVAKKLLDDEAAGKGTNQVVQRLCGIAARTWALKR